MMVRTLTRLYSTQNVGSFRLFDNPMRHHHHQQQNTTAAGSNNEHVADVDDNLIFDFSPGCRTRYSRELFKDSRELGLQCHVKNRGRPSC